MTRAKPGFEEPLGIVVDGERVQVQVRRSAKARRVRLRIGDFGAEIVLPLRAPYKHADSALCEHRAWVERTWRKRTHRWSVQAPVGQVLFHGRWQGAADLADKLTGDPETSMERLEAAMRAQAACELRRAVDHWSAVMGLVPTKVSVRDQKTKWGACSSRGTVTFNWRLVMAPPAVLEYVVLHELAHLKELNHSPRFWAIVRAYCPDYPAHKRWLRDHEPFLKADGTAP